MEVEKNVEARAAKLVDQLRSVPHDVIAVVTHKAFLRAITRIFAALDPNPKAEVKLFANAEVRAFRMVWHVGKAQPPLLEVQSVQPGAPAPAPAGACARPAKSRSVSTHHKSLNDLSEGTEAAQLRVLQAPARCSSVPDLCAVAEAWNDSMAHIATPVSCRGV